MEDEPRLQTTGTTADLFGTPLKKPTLGKSTSLPAPTRYRSTPPPTPPSACSPYHTPSERMAEMASPRSRGKGIVAPTSAVDDVAEKFGRPRAKSLSRRELSLTVWEEEDAVEGAAAAAVLQPSPPVQRFEDRRRSASMSVAEEYRRDRPDRQGVAFTKQCLECHLPPSYATEGEPPIFCREHQMEGMVNVLREGCSVRGCNKTPSYGFQGQGRQRCFSHMEDGMVHVLSSSLSTASTATTSTSSTCEAEQDS